MNGSQCLSESVLRCYVLNRSLFCLVQLLVNVCSKQQYHIDAKTFFAFFNFVIKTRFNVVLLCQYFFIFRATVIYMLLEDYFLWNWNRKIHWIVDSCIVSIYISRPICYIRRFLHWLNYSSTVSVIRWPHCHGRHCFINSLFQLVQIILQTTSFTQHSSCL